eukprot:1875152-Prymnesium_polylepis.1
MENLRECVANPRKPSRELSRIRRESTKYLRKITANLARKRVGAVSLHPFARTSPKTPRVCPGRVFPTFQEKYSSAGSKEKVAHFSENIP